jgi:hypothetical protein
MNGRKGFSHLMFIRAVVAHLWSPRERCGIVAVATALASHAQTRSGDRCFPSTKTLVVESGVSRPTVLKAKKRLKAAGFLDYENVGRAHGHHYRLMIPETVAVNLQYRDIGPGGQSQVPRDDRRGQSPGFSRSSRDTASRSNTDTRTETLEHRQENGTTSPACHKDDSEEDNKRAKALAVKATGAEHRIGPSVHKVEEELLRARAAGVSWHVLAHGLLRTENAGQNVWVITDPLREDARLRWKEPARSVIAVRTRPTRSP